MSVWNTYLLDDLVDVLHAFLALLSGLGHVRVFVVSVLGVAFDVVGVKLDFVHL